MEGKDSKHVVIVGAGLAGAMASCLLSKLGYQITVYEKRPNSIEASNEGGHEAFGNTLSALKRSINLALSQRGIDALNEIGLTDEVMKNAIRMPGRWIHSDDGKIRYQPYGRKDQAIFSVGRQTLNELLIKHAQLMNPNIAFYFEHSVIGVSKDGKCTVKTAEGEVITKQFDMIIGADGAFSAVREEMMKGSRINFSRQYCTHGYKELCIPAKMDESGNKSFALANHEGLHIWPRGDFMLIALPNPDMSFTVTMFAPFKGKNGFESIDANNSESIQAYFQRNFKEVLPLIPDIVHEYTTNPIGALQTVRVDPWFSGKIILIGDASHAVVPFYGQGMNAAFEDALLLYKTIRSNSNDSAESIFKKFAEPRVGSVNCLADLCLQHLFDMSANTKSQLYLTKIKFGQWLNYLFPSCFVPEYTMVAFTNMPFDQIVKILERQNTFVNGIFLGLSVVLGATGWCLYRRKFW